MRSIILASISLALSQTSSAESLARRSEVHAQSNKHVSERTHGGPNCGGQNGLLNVALANSYECGNGGGVGGVGGLGGLVGGGVGLLGGDGGILGGSGGILGGGSFPTGGIGGARCGTQSGAINLALLNTYNCGNGVGNGGGPLPPGGFPPQFPPGGFPPQLPPFVPTCGGGFGCGGTCGGGFGCGGGGFGGGFGDGGFGGVGFGGFGGGGVGFGGGGVGFGGGGVGFGDIGGGGVGFGGIGGFGGAVVQHSDQFQQSSGSSSSSTAMFAKDAKKKLKDAAKST